MYRLFSANLEQGNHCVPVVGALAFHYAVGKLYFVRHFDFLFPALLTRETHASDGSVSNSVPLSPAGVTRNRYGGRRIMSAAPINVTMQSKVSIRA